MVHTHNQQYVQQDNVNSSVRNASRLPNPSVSATHPSRLGAQSVPLQHWQLSTSSQCSFHHQPMISPHRSHGRRTPSLERDSVEFARAHADQFEEFCRHYREKEPMKRRHDFRSLWRSCNRNRRKRHGLNYSPRPKMNVVQGVNPQVQSTSIGPSVILNPSQALI